MDVAAYRYKRQQSRRRKWAVKTRMVGPAQPEMASAQQGRSHIQRISPCLFHRSNNVASMAVSTGGEAETFYFETFFFQ
jgi:hypothetical protein